MNQTYSFVICGAGGIANAWMDAFKNVPEARIVGIVDIRLEAAKALAEKYGFPADIAGTNLKDMLSQKRPDAVVDCTIPAAHKQVTLTSFEMGCHVLGEKPLSDSLENAVEMVTAAKEAKKLYMVSQNYRWNPAVRAIRKAIADGIIGRVTTINCDFYIGAHFGGFRDQMDHPLLLDMSIHHFDLARCMSQLDPEAVYCREFNPHGSWYKGDVAATAVFEMSEGAVFTYRGSWAAEGMNTGWNGIWRIIGEKGTITWSDIEAPTAEVVTAVTGQFHNEWKKETLELDNKEPVQWQGSLTRFLKALRSGRKPETWGGDNIKSLAMVLCAVESAKKLKRVKVKIPRKKKQVTVS